MTLQEIHSVLKSRPFKLTNHKGESCKLIFTEIYVIREEKIIAEYEIRENGNQYTITFIKVVNGDLANVKNILLVIDNFTTILNFDSLQLQQIGRIDCFLIGL
jgi:hypothetical protein